MSYLVPKPKILKRCGSQLEVRVRKTHPQEVLRPCPLNCKSSNALRISFFTHTRSRYLDSSSSTLLGADQETTGERTICVDNCLFFNGHHQLRNQINFSQVLESLNVKEYLLERITSQIMSMGECKYKGGKKVKRKIFKGLHVDLISIQTFLGDQDSVHELFQKSMEEYGKGRAARSADFITSSTKS